MPIDTPYSCYDKMNLGTSRSIPSNRNRMAMDLAFEMIDRKTKKLTPADHVAAIEELIEEAQTFLALTRRPVHDGVELTSDEAVELWDVASGARPLSIVLRHAQRKVGTGPLDRHHEHKRQTRCTTTSTSAGSDPEYR